MAFKNAVRGCAVLLASAGLACAAEQLTARQVIERIQKNAGVEWQKDTVDVFKAGNPDTPVKGIATTFMATMDVLERAVKAGDNLIISHEPIFYNHPDKTTDFENDPVYKQKREYIEKNGLVVWRFHDHLHARKPDSVIRGLATSLGWEKNQKPGDLPLYVIPETTVGKLASDIAARMKIKTLRVVGDPKLKVTKAALVPGAAGPQAHLWALRSDDCEVLLIGETTEWETIAYVRDAAAEGRHKALILMGHVPSEESGMSDTIPFLKSVVPGVKIDFVPAGEPFWTVK